MASCRRAGTDTGIEGYGLTSLALKIRLSVTGGLGQSVKKSNISGRAPYNSALYQEPRRYHSGLSLLLTENAMLKKHTRP